MFSPLLAGEPVPGAGRLELPDMPGFGVELDPATHARTPLHTLHATRRPAMRFLRVGEPGAERPAVEDGDGSSTSAR